MSEETLYSIVAWDYVDHLGQFLRQLCLGLVEKWAESVAMDAVKPPEGECGGQLLGVVVSVSSWSPVAAILECWHGLVSVFTPWVAPVVSSRPQPAT